MTVIRPNGISGITSITSSGDAINFYKSDGTLGPVLGLNINATTGISTFAALNVTGVLTYEDVTSVDSVGIITARSDLSIADKIIHTGDTNTAIRFPAADTVTVETSGNEALRVNSSGEVSIGTVTGGKTLTLFGTSSSSFRISKSGVLAYDHTFDGSSYTIANNNGSGGIPLIIGTKTAGAESLRIDSDGNFGLGAAPTNYSGYNTLMHNASTGATFEQRVGGTLKGSLTTDTQVTLKSLTSIPLVFATANTERLRIDSSGNMGLSTNSPRTRLDLGANGVSHLRWGAWSELGEESSHNSLVLGNNVYVDGNNTKVRNTSVDGYRAIRMKYDEGITFHTTDANVTADDALDNERMRITTSGQMGLGTNNPVQQSGKGLHIHNSGGQTRIKLTNNVTGATANDGFDIIQEHNNDVHILNHEAGVLKFGTNDAERMRIDANGLVGINMTPANTASNTYPLQIYSPGSQCFLTLGNSNTGSGPSNGLVLGNDGSSAYIWNRENTPIQFATNNTERVRIDSSGNMGLGTNNPAKKLHISDTSGPAQIRITGSSGSSDIYADANIYFQPNGTTRVTMNSSGQLLVGTTSSRSGATTYGSTAPAVLIERAVNSHSNADLMLINNSSSAYYPKLTLATTKGSTANSHGNIGPSEAMGYIVFAGSDGTNLIEGARIAGITDAATSTTNMPTRLSFYTNGGSASSPTERFRIDRVGQNKMLSGSSTSTLELRNGSGSGTSNRLLYGLHSATALNNGTPIYSIFTNGTVGTPSDIRLKKNVETTRDGYLSDLASLRVVKYHWNTQEDTEPKELGLIAQEVETVFPGLIHTEGEGDEEVKEIKRSVIPMMLLKALQEANAKIETLEEKVAALEG